jgi:hypothetical protein
MTSSTLINTEVSDEEKMQGMQGQRFYKYPDGYYLVLLFFKKAEAYMSDKIEQARLVIESEMESHGYKIVRVNRNYGRVIWSWKTCFIPVAKTRKSLYLVCHELGHIVLGKPKTVYEGEMEAEKYARAKMRELGFSVPRLAVARGNRYVAMKTRRAVRRGLKEVSPKVRRFLNTEV